MLLGYTFCDFYHLLSVSVEMLLTVTLIPQFSIKQNWGKETVWGLYLSSFCVSKILFPLLKPANHNLDNKRSSLQQLFPLPGTIILQLFIISHESWAACKKLLQLHEPVTQHLLCRRQNLPPCVSSKVNKCFAGALGFKRKIPSKNIITKFKQPWKIQLKWPL